MQKFWQIDGCNMLLILYKLNSIHGFLRQHPILSSINLQKDTKSRVGKNNFRSLGTEFPMHNVDRTILAPHDEFGAALVIALKMVVSRRVGILAQLIHF